MLCRRESHLARTHTARCLNLDCSEDYAVVATCALSLRYLAFGAKLLEDHLGVSTLVRVGMVETHWKAVIGVMLIIMTVELLGQAVGIVGQG
jgi:hypothetical protein